MAKKLTAGVLKGTSYKETFPVEWNGEQFEVEIRPLNNEEAIQVEELSQEGVNVRMKPGLKGKMTRLMDFDAKANFRGRKLADIKAVALGTTDEAITEEIVKKEFPPKMITEIAAQIKKISGIGNPQEVQEFNDGDDTPSDSE